MHNVVHLAFLIYVVILLPHFLLKVIIFEYYMKEIKKKEILLGKHFLLIHEGE